MSAAEYRKFSGVVVCNGQPVVGAEVVLDHLVASGYTLLPTATNINGEFLILRVPARMVGATLTVRAPNCVSQWCDATDLPTTPVRIELQPAFREQP